MDEDREIPEIHGGSDAEDELVEELRGSYNPPPATPREEMWAAIEAKLEPRADGASTRGAKVVSLEAVRARRMPATHRWAGLAVAAAALLVLGVGIGRMSVRTPSASVSPGRSASAEEAPDPTAMRLAAMEHLGRSESLLTVVQSDARTGRLDPQVGPWARDLLAQTRLLLDASDQKDPAMKRLLEDLELVLVQIVGVTDTGAHDAARTRTELNLALKGLRDRDVLPRIQAVVPAGDLMSGTD